MYIQMPMQVYGHMSIHEWMHHTRLIHTPIHKLSVDAHVPIHVYTHVYTHVHAQVATAKAGAQRAEKAKVIPEVPAGNTRRLLEKVFLARMTQV